MNTPTVAYRDAANGGRATVMAYNGTNWVVIGPAGFSAGTADYTSLAFDNTTGVSYVVYRDGANGNRATVMRYNGVTWVNVGTAGFSAGAVSFTTIAIDGSGTPYVSYMDGGNGNRATVMKFNGTNWVTVGTAGFSVNTAAFISMAVDRAGTPYVVYRDGSVLNKGTVMMFDGTNWVTVGLGITPAGVQLTGIAMDSKGIPYIVYQDATAGSGASVQKLVPNPTVPIVQVTSVPSGAVAASTPITFTAATSNAVAPSYQWYRNDVAVGTNSNKYSTSTYNNGDVISCAITSVCGGQAATGVGSTTTIINPVVSASGTCLCASAVCTLNTVSNVPPSYIVWRRNATIVDTRYALWNTNGITVAGGNGAGSAANQLDQPWGVHADQSGNIYVMDGVNQRVQKWAPSAVSGVTVAGGNGLGSAANQFSGALGIAVDGIGNVYVADAGNHRIQKWAPGATQGITVAGGNGNGNGASQLNTPYAVFLDAEGNLYIADAGNHRIQKWAPGASTGTTVAGGNGAGAAANQLNDPTGVYVDNAGNVYIADNDNHRIQKWAPSAIAGTTVAGGNGPGSASNQLNFPIDVCVDATGMIYVTDNLNNRIVRWVPTATSGASIAGNGTVGPAAFQFNSMGSVRLDASGNLYVSDRGNNRVQKFTPASSLGHVLSQDGSYHAEIFTFAGGYNFTNTLTVTSFDYPDVQVNANPGVTVAAGTPVTFTATYSNNVHSPSYQWYHNYVPVGINSNTYSTNAYSNGDVIACEVTSNCTFANRKGVGSATMKVIPGVSITSPGNCVGTTLTANSSVIPSRIVWKNNGTTVATVEASWNNNGVTVAGGNGSGAGANQLSGPFSVYVSPANDVIIPELSNDRVATWPALSVSGTTLFGTGVPGVSQTTLNGPAGITVNPLGKLVVSDMSNNRVLVYPTNPVAGSPAERVMGQLNFFSAIAGSGANNLSSPLGVFVDSKNTVYIADHNNHRVQKYVEGSFTGVTVAGGAGSGSGAHQLDEPSGVFVDEAGNIYVADYGNNRIQMWAPNAPAGITVAGGNGLGSGANQFSGPRAVWVDGSGSIYVADQLNSRIQRWLAGATSGTTIAGGNGAGAAANQFNSANGLFLDAAGNLYVADIGNARIQKFTLNTTTSYLATAAGNYTAEITTLKGGVVNTTTQVTVNAPSVPAISVVSNAPSNTICTGTSVTFTATPVDGGSSPIYQWKKNGNNVGANSTTYIDNALVNGDVITCQLTSNAVCVTTATATSTPLVMTVNPIPTVNTVTNKSVCHNNTSAAINFSGPVGGTTYAWTNNNTSIGLGINGSGNIAPFTATNAGASPVTATITVTPTANGCAGTPSNFTITVNPTSTPAPAVSIGVSPSNTGCQGNTFTFTATPTGGGATPTYQWYRSGVPVGTGAVLAPPANFGLNGHAITCVMTSSQQCPSVAQVTSNTINMTVHPLATPVVQIAAYPTQSAVCVGTPVTFTAVPTSGGSSPAYQWKLNGNNVTTGSTYTASSLPVGSHTVSVTMTSSYPCPNPATATANYNITVNPIVTPSITFSSAQVNNGNICQGANVTFTATPTNGGSAPVYVWSKNNVTVGGNSASYNAGTGLVSGDVIKVQMTSNAACQTTNFSQAAPVTVNVWPNATNNVSIVSDAPNNSGCLGLPVVFTATSTNGGTNPVYEWRKGSTVVGTNSATYTDATLVNGDQISCRVTTNLPCATPAIAISNTITMTINPVITTAVEIGVNPDSAGCEGDPFLFSAYPQNEGTNPKYQWYVNGTLVPGSVQHQYSSNTLKNGDLVSCELISSMTCAFPVTSDAISMDLTPSPEPKAQIVGVPGGDGIIFYSTVTDAGPGATLQWIKNGANLQGETGPTYTGIGLQPEDQVSLLVHSIVECADPEFVLSNVVEVKKVTSVSGVPDMFNELTLYPNPNTGKFRLKGTLNTNAKEADIEVMNSIGQSVYKGNTKLHSNAIDTEIDMRSRVVPGMYMLRISIDGQLSSLRFVIE